jgi:starvation-inducible DNA-binding protein
MGKAFPTRSGIPQTTRNDMIALLNGCLATSAHLGLHAKLAHWNVRGPDFFQLHALFDKVYEAATGWTDQLAERTVQLGGVAEATLSLVSERTQLKEYDLGLSAGPDHVDALAESLAVFGRMVREAVDKAEAHGDAATADLFTELARGADEQLWFVEAHLQAER